MRTSKGSRESKESTRSAVSRLARRLTLGSRQGIKPDDTRLQQYKRAALWFNVLCIVGLMVQLALICVHQSTAFYPKRFYFRIASSVVLITLLVAAIGWYFKYQSHAWMKCMGTVTGVAFILERWLITGCNAMSVGADAFLPGFILLPMLFCMGASRREAFLHVVLFSLLAVMLYTIQFVTDPTRMHEQNPLCPFTPKSDFVTIGIEPLFLIVCTNVVEFLSLSVFVQQMSEHETTLENDAALGWRMLNAVANLDLEAMRAVVRDNETNPDLSTSNVAMVQILDTMARIRPYIPDTLFSPSGDDNIGCEVSECGTDIVQTLGNNKGQWDEEDDHPREGVMAEDNASDAPYGGGLAEFSMSTSIAALKPILDTSPGIGQGSEEFSVHPGGSSTWAVKTNPLVRVSLSAQNKRGNLPDGLGLELPSSDSNLHLMTGLQQKQVTILVANISELHSKMEESNIAIELPLSESTTAMVAIVKRHRGTVVSFSGGILTAAFNAISRNAAHANYGCQSALEIHAKMKQLKVPMPVRIGLHTCDALVGNLGTSHVATFHLLTRGLSVCWMLSKLNKQLSTKILISDSCRQLVKGQFDVRGVDMLRFAEAAGVSGGHMEVSELLEEARTTDEWMYHLHAGQQDFDVGWECMKRGDYVAARRCFERHIDACEGDDCARRLFDMAVCRAQRNDPTPYERRVGVPWECLEQKGQVH